MAVHCAQCGEELMGSVNRCWRCGREFVSRTGPADVPPIRRRPIVGPLDGAAEAEIVSDEVVAEPGEAAATLRGDGAQSAHRRWTRRGSPFANTDEPVSAFVDVDEVRLPKYPSRPGSAGAAAAAIVLAVIGLSLLFVFPVATLILSAVGVTFGCLALRGERRKAATLGLLLCCAVFAFAVFFATAALYSSWYGFTIWETYGVL